MAHEVFDNVAFFFFLSSVLSFVTIPWTIYLIVSAACARFSSAKNNKHDQNCSCAECREHAKLESLKKQEKGNGLFTTKNVIFVLLWVALIYCFSRKRNG